MNIGVAYENGRIAKNLGDCREVLIITIEGREPVGKRIAGIAGTSATDLIKFAGLEQIDVLICGSLGLATRNALEMLGVLLVPGCEGSAEESVCLLYTSNNLRVNFPCYSCSTMVFRASGFMAGVSFSGNSRPSRSYFSMHSLWNGRNSSFSKLG